MQEMLNKLNKYQRGKEKKHFNEGQTIPEFRGFTNEFKDSVPTNIISDQILQIDLLKSRSHSKDERTSIPLQYSKEG